MMLVLLGLFLIGATVFSVVAPRSPAPPVIYLRAESPAEAGDRGGAGFALIIFAVLAMVVALAAQ